MSSKKVGSSWGDFEMIRAYQQGLRAIQKGGVVVKTLISDSGRLGAVLVWMEAYVNRPGSGERPVARITSEWPNDRPSTLPAHMFQMVTKLAALVDDYLAPPF